MKRRILSLLLVVLLLLNSTVTVLACDEGQVNVYVQKVLLGDSAMTNTEKQNLDVILNALFICSEQADKEGQEKLKALTKAKVGNVPTLAKVNVSSNDLFECTHQSWTHTSINNPKEQDYRKDVLRKSIIKTFDFGWFNECFNSKRGKIDSFAALLYYTHILADYLADDPLDTTISAKGYDIPAYSGNAAYQLNGGVPKFTQKQKAESESYKEYSDFDDLERCGPAIANIGPDTLATVGNRNEIGNIHPTGWQQGNVKYSGIIPNELYNRCHLIAHSLGGADTGWNLITGTRYLNEAMIEYEQQVADYVNQTGNHVLYRVTPVYKGANKVASGVQIEAYSVEDKGRGLSFNVYLYNVQPGIDIDYSNGKSKLADQTVSRIDIIPFATTNPSDSNPDLMYEINKQLNSLFADQKNSKEYSDMIKELELKAEEIRRTSGHSDWKVYSTMKKHQYEYVKILSEHVPRLLSKEDFFKTAFK